MMDSSNANEEGRAQSSVTTAKAALYNVPSHLHIKVLHFDNDVIVLDKPNDLRSVPGHANNPPSTQSNGSDATKLTTQQAWVKAIELLGEEDAHAKQSNEKVAMEELAVMEIIHNLGSSSSNTAGVPRKLETFIKYCHRNSRRLLPSYPDLHSWGSQDVAKDQSSEPPKKKQKHDNKREIPAQIRSIAQTCFAKIQQKQRPLEKQVQLLLLRDTLHLIKK